MIAVIQRAESSEIEIEKEETRSAGRGLVVLVGIEAADTEEDIKWLVSKIIKLRIFDDENGKMNLSVTDIDGDILVVSQFTLHASTKKGTRPSYIKAAPPTVSEPIYNHFVEELKLQFNEDFIVTGKFGAYMKIKLINDGPVTIHIDTKNKV